MKEKALTWILLVAGMLGIVQGLLTFIGGLVAAHDTSADSIPNSIPNLTPHGKYWCGMIRRAPADVNCNFESLDRGWFKRVHDAVHSGDYNYSATYSNVTTSYIASKDDLKGLTGYEAVVSYAVVCGIGWFVAGGLAIRGARGKTRAFAVIALLVFVSMYCLFIGLFGPVWDSVLKVESDCQPVYDATCDEFRKHVTSSAREFLAYSICSFVLIAAAIAGCVVYICVEPELAYFAESSRHNPSLPQGELPRA